MECRPIIPLFKVYMSKRVDEPLLHTLHSGWIGEGPRVKEFEAALSKKFSNPYCLTLSAGTHGLHLALRLLDIWERDSVITSSLTCTASNWPILMQNANIIWADIDPESLNISPDSIREKITKRTKAILVVHWGGYPCDMEEIYQISKEYDIPVIEDAAHAYGSFYKDHPIGDCRYSNFAMISFQAIKHMTSVTPDTPVIINIDGKVKIEQIGKIDDKIVGKKCLSFTKDGKTKWGNIYGFTKHYIDDEILDIKLEKGRSISITKDHSVYTHDGDKFVPIFGKDLKVGNFLSVPRYISIDTKIVSKIDILDLLKKDNLMVWNDEIRLSYEGRGGQAGKWINRYIEIDEDFCKILGYYAAEGSIVKYSRNGKKTDTISIVFSMGAHEENTYIRDLISCLERKFPTYKVKKLRVGKNKQGIKSGMKIFFGSSLFAKIIKGLNPGRNAHTKRIPDIMWNVSSSCKKAFVEGYINGDGSRRVQDGYTKYESFASASKDLINGIHYLLLSIGIQTSALKKEEGYTVNSKFEPMNRYSAYLINKDGQKSAKENCIPNKYVNGKVNSHKSFTIDRILDEELDCPDNLLNDIGLLKIKEIRKRQYKGYVYDFSVEEYENFIGGYGAICLHNTVDGGVLFCRNEEHYKQGKLLRWYGIDREGPRTDFRCESDIPEWGYKYHMNDVCATIGLVNMQEVDENIAIAQDNAKYYREQLKDFSGITLLQNKTDRVSSYWLFTILVENRTDFMMTMSEKRIMVSRVHERNDKHSCLFPFKCDLPNLDSIIDKMICLPVGWWVTKEDREYVTSCVKEGW